MYGERPHVPRPDAAPPSDAARKAVEYRREGAELREKIAALKTPLAHGTTSEYLDGILERSLGGDVPVKAYAGTKSATDLRMPDGLLGAYLFSRFDTSGLEVTSEDVSGEDAITRYAKLNPNIGEARLREAFSAYVAKRKPEGFPVVLVYDGGGDARIAHTNPRVPSEVEFEGELTSTKLRLVMVPKSKIEEVKAGLAAKNVSAGVLPVEILEVD